MHRTRDENLKRRCGPISQLCLGAVGTLPDHAFARTRRELQICVPSGGAHDGLDKKSYGGAMAIDERVNVRQKRQKLQQNGAGSIHGQPCQHCTAMCKWKRKRSVHPAQCGVCAAQSGVQFRRHERKPPKPYCWAPRRILLLR